MYKRLFILIVVALMAENRAAATPVYIHQEKSLYRNILVYEENDVRCLVFGKHSFSHQTCIYKEHPDAMVFDYTRMLLGSLYFVPAPKKILVIGLGGGVLPTALQKLVPSAQIDIVEIDPAVTKVASKFFNFAAAPATRIHEEDGRVYVKRMLRQKQLYDIVMLDAFDFEYIPEHMLTREFLQEFSGILAPHGVVAANTFSSSKLYSHESTTYHAVFGEFYNLKKNNRVIIAAKNGLLSPVDIEKSNIRFQSLLDGYDINKTWFVPLLVSKPDWPADARILTDQYSPANLLNAQ